MRVASVKNQNTMTGLLFCILTYCFFFLHCCRRRRVTSFEDPITLILSPSSCLFLYYFCPGLNHTFLPIPSGLACHYNAPRITPSYFPCEKLTALYNNGERRGSSYHNDYHLYYLSLLSISYILTASTMIDSKHTGQC